MDIKCIWKRKKAWSLEDLSSHHHRTLLSCCGRFLVWREFHSQKSPCAHCIFTGCPQAAPPLPQQYHWSSRALLWQSLLALPGSLPQSYPTMSHEMWHYASCFLWSFGFHSYFPTWHLLWQETSNALDTFALRESKKSIKFH